MGPQRYTGEAPQMVSHSESLSAKLLLNNPGFEAVSFSTYSNGPYSLAGWSGINTRYNQHSVQNGTVLAQSTTEGIRRFRMDWGGELATASGARVAAVAGARYEMMCDLRALVRNFPVENLGTRLYLESFDTAGVRIKKIWGPEWNPIVQDAGVNVWETFTVRGMAPSGTASVGVKVEAPHGQYQSEARNFEDDRHVEVDNVRLYLLKEPLDRISYRRVPRLVEPGKIATLKLHHAAPVARILKATLVNQTGAECASATQSVAAGRYRATTIDVAIPQTLPNAVYRWVITLHASATSSALVTRSIEDIIIDEAIESPTLNATDFPADHPKISFMGRIEALPNGAKRWHWFGSEVRLRFSGTSLNLVGGVTGNGFGGHFSQQATVIIDENFNNPITVALPTSSNFRFPLVSGLADGIHSVRLFKSDESDRWIRFDAFAVDAGRGLLRPEPLSTRKLSLR